MMKLYTRKQYMNKEVSFNDYYLQFATESTRLFVENQVGLDKIKRSTCPHLNDTARHTFNGGWVWDRSPINLKLARELGEVGKNSTPSPATCTCVGKAMAKQILKELN